MDAVEYLKEKDRMCQSHATICYGCPIYEMGRDTDLDCIETIRENKKQAVEAVEKWSKEHPKKIRQDKILEVFPNARKDDNGVIMICPYYTGVINDCGVDCSNCWECREKYWLEEVEE